MIVDFVYVISLAARVERRERLTAAWPYPGLLPLRFVTAVPGGAGGCLLSHIAALGAAAGPALILEDDAVFAPDFTLDAAALAPPADWAVLWLGRQLLAPPHPVDQRWARPWRIARTHAYVAADPGRLARLLDRATAVDPGLSRLPVPQYLLRTATVGQAAGPSDIGGHVRAADTYWN